MDKTGEKQEMANRNPPEEHRFKPGQSGNPKGRPKGVLSDLSAIIPSKDDIFRAIMLLLDKPLEELYEIAKDKDAPAYQVVIAKALITDVAKGQISTAEAIFNRIFGKPKENQQVSGSITIRKRLFDGVINANSKTE